MFPRNRVVAACLVLAFLGLSGLYAYAASITPRDLRIADIGGEDIGLPVRVRGHVHRVWTTDGGSVGLVLMDYEDFATIRVVARARAIADPASVVPGAVVAVVGEVFGTGGFVQLFADEGGAITVVAPASTNLVTLEFVARNAVRLEGHRVLVRGVLADARTVIDSRHALLHADGASLWAYRADGWQAGRANVTGRLVETSRGRCELFSAPEPEPLAVTMPELAACPETLVGVPVRVVNVTVSPGELLGSTLTLRAAGDGAEFRLPAFIRQWDWQSAARPLAVGNVLVVEGVVDYQVTEARWRLLADAPPRT